MSDRSWKAFERRLARDMGSERIPVTGERAGADFEDGLFVYQAKLGRRAPAYLAAWLGGIRAAGRARRPEKVGVIAWKPKGAEDVEAVVILAWGDWVALHGSVPAPPLAVAELAPPALEARQRFPKALHAPNCAWAGCGKPLPVGERQRGTGRRFCSARCRWAAWAAEHPRESRRAA